MSSSMQGPWYPRQVLSYHSPARERLKFPRAILEAWRRDILAARLQLATPTLEDMCAAINVSYYTKLYPCTHISYWSQENAPSDTAILRDQSPEEIMTVKFNIETIWKAIAVHKV